MTGSDYLRHLRQEWRLIRDTNPDDRAERMTAIEVEAKAIQTFADAGLGPEVISAPARAKP